MNYSCKIIVHWWTERRKVSVLTWNVGFTQCKILRYKVTAHQTKGLSGFPPFPPSSGWALWSSGQSLRSIGCNRWGDQVADNWYLQRMKVWYFYLTTVTETTAVSLPGPASGGTHTGTGSTPLSPAGPAPACLGSRHLRAHHRPQHRTENIYTPLTETYISISIFLWI